MSGSGGRQSAVLAFYPLPHLDRGLVSPGPTDSVAAPFGRCAFWGMVLGRILTRYSWVGGV